MSAPKEVVADVTSTAEREDPEVLEAWKVLQARYRENPERFRERWRKELAAKKKP